MELRDILTQLRTERDIKQYVVAQAINVDSSMISKYEKGTNCPDYSTLIKIADFYDVNLDYLLGRTDIRTSMRTLEGKLKTRSGPVPIDGIFRLSDADKEIIGLMLHSLLQKQENRKK